MNLYDSFLNNNNNNNKSLQYPKKRESESILNLSKKNQDETVLSNSIILTVISNFLDLNNIDNTKKISKKKLDTHQTQRKKSSLTKSNIRTKEISKTVYRENKDKINIQINKSVLSNQNRKINKKISSKKLNNRLSLEYNNKKGGKSREATQIMKEIYNNNNYSNNNIKQNKLDLEKMTKINRKGTLLIGEARNSKYIENIIGLERIYDEGHINRKKTMRPIRKKNNNVVTHIHNINNNVNNISTKKKKRNSSFMNNFNLNLNLNMKEKENSNEIMNILFLRKIHKKLKNNIENKIKDKLYEYENNDITDAINKLPIAEPTKTNNTYENSISDKNSTFLDNNNKLFKDDTDIITQNENKIKRKDKRRSIILKGNVYDSLDDEEIIDEEIVQNFFFEPDCNFLYFFDSLIMISSFIILIYLPIYLAKNISFCHSFLNINNIIFYLIDLIYIIDVVISFFRAYYNFDEILIRKSNDICKHYLKTWLFFDLITSVPVFTLLKFLNNKCTNDKGNVLLFSNYYNINLHNLHYLLTFFKIIKTFKVFKYNISVQKLGKILNEYEFISDWGNVFLFLLFLLFSINFSACIFIFIGRNTYRNWIVKFHYEYLHFFHIYIAAIYYIIFTITTVGYGDLLGHTLLELVFQTIVLIAGTCIYSWLISATSSYIKKMNDRKLKYENKIKILEDIRLTNPYLTKDLYEKIIRLLNYRKYYEQIDKQVILESLPYSLRNSLTIEMYKPFINNFIFFRTIKNRDFLVKVVSKLNPVLSVKGDILIKEGDFIEDIIFVKDGVLSLEIKINLDYPEKSIEEYLSKYKLIKKKTNYQNKNEKTSNLHKDNEIMTRESLKNKISEIYRGTTFSTTSVLKKFNFNLHNSYIEEDDENTTYIKITNIRKNEHYGDVFMFLNKNSPLYVRVRTKKAEVLLLKKLDAVTISTTYPKIWKKIISKSLTNTKKIKNLTLKMLITFCNFHGIKTKFFKQQKYCINDIKNFLYESATNSNVFLSKRKVLPLNTEIQKNLNEINPSGNNYEDYINSSYYNSDASQLYSKSKGKIDTMIYEKKEEDNISEETLKNKYKNTLFKRQRDFFKLNSVNSELSIKNLTKNYTEKQPKNNNSSSSYSKSSNKTNKKEKNKNNSKTSTKTNNSKNFINNNLSKKITNNKEESSSINKNSNKTFTSNNNSDDYDNSNESECTQNNNDNNNNKLNKEKVNNYEETKSNKTLNINLNDINDEIYLGESFNLQRNNNIDIINSNKIKNTFYSDKIYINNVNIFENKEKTKSEEKKFKNLEISSQSTMDINSSYENINKLTNYNYISDDDLRKKTKKFLLEECKIHFSEKKIPKINKNIKQSKKSISSNFINTIIKKNKNNQNKNRNSSLPTYKSFKSNYKFLKYKSEIKRTSSFKKNNSIEGKEPNSSIHKSYFWKKEKEKDKYKKGNNIKEMVMISNNIKQNTENLNNPESFYYGLFNNILERHKIKSNVQSNHIIKSKIKVNHCGTKK